MNHHPHVLQGFEVYDGRLIAHSMGNFIFDLYYPETMPTIVLTLEMTKEAIVGYTFVPAWIDDYIPQPATGRLGREIMDRMADYSRDMGALVVVFPEEDRARILLSRDEADSTAVPSEAAVPLYEEDGYFTSPPIALAGEGNLSEITAIVSGVSGWEVCWGREILWHGVFEEEGATFWDTNTADEWLDESEAHGGLRSLALRRTAGDGEPVGTDLEKHLPCDPEKRHSFAGFMKGDNAAEAQLMARFYSSRYASQPISSTDVGPPLTGTQDWFRQWRNLETPENADYFEVRCHNEPPAEGTGHAWFDDLAFIEWEEWRAAETPMAVPAPNNFRFVQLRTPQAGTGDVTLQYAETRYEPGTSSLPESAPDPARRRALRCAPNPFGRETRIELRLPRASGPLPVDVGVYDVQGRRIATLFRGRLQGGVTRSFSWSGIDQAGRAVASGVYFARVDVGSETWSRKLLRIR
ncbi:MAG: hypothetical protein GF355_07845 [Candidatus Eisenbacteria bacterium]|nr:hypothetical protein [Candidatus Eisenbacteria bacterium]